MWRRNKRLKRQSEALAQSANQRPPIVPRSPQRPPPRENWVICAKARLEKNNFKKVSTEGGVFKLNLGLGFNPSKLMAHFFIKVTGFAVFYWYFHQIPVSLIWDSWPTLEAALMCAISLQYLYSNEITGFSVFYRFFEKYRSIWFWIRDLLSKLLSCV